MEKRELLLRLKSAFSLFGLKEKLLFLDSPLERPAITRLAMHCQYLFPEFEVDCEYGRYESRSKQLDIKSVNEDVHALLRTGGLETSYRVWRNTKESEIQSAGYDELVKLVVPDLVIHRRREQHANLLFLEAKPTDDGWDTTDAIKLCLVTAGVNVNQRPLQYLYGLQVNLRLNSGTEGYASARLWFGGKVANEVEFPY
jgi:hypothetical protein